MFGSEAKSLTPFCEKVEIFPPGHYYENGQFISYLDITNVLKASTDPLAAVLKNIKEKLIAGVEKRLDADVPVGFLLSGGLDSSLVCAIARRVLNKPITTFAIGMNINPIDLKYAKQAADFIGCHHHEVIFTDEDIKTHLSDVIFALETWDITTIRASIGMYLVCRYVKQKTKIKVLLTGEISDELLGYKYTDFAPSPEAFQKEAEKRIREIHFYDVLRADRSISAHGLEARVPFGDIDFVHYVMHIDPKLKINTTGIGKYLLRKAFEDGNYLPPDLLYRDKAAFSDAVGHRMVDYLKELAEEKYSDQQFEKKKKNFSHCPPMSKEALMYREIFEDFYPEQSHLIKDYWLPNREWENCNVTDPSARVLPNYGKSGH
jgi:asparagine synthase (glutamine-hydrolysing)